jgi:putative aldouronate transport system permease protein
MNKKLSKDAKQVLLIALPGLLFLFLFKYIPMAGNIIAFKNYNLFQGIWGSPWAGMEHFVRMFTFPDFQKVFVNSLRLGVYSIVFGFPAPLILALLINEVRLSWFKRSLQTVLYLPHFLSWVIVGGIFINLLDPLGVINGLLVKLGFSRIDFLTNPNTFIGTLITIGIWKEVGWGMIIYLAALAGINPNLYEAAMVDGANRWQQMRHVSLPSLMPSIIVLLLLRIGNLLDANVEQMLVFLNPLVRDVGEVFDTYIYRLGLLGGQYSYTTAIGMFKSVVGLILVAGVNELSKRTTGESIY